MGTDHYDIICKGQSCLFVPVQLLDKFRRQNISYRFDSLKGGFIENYHVVLGGIAEYGVLGIPLQVFHEILRVFLQEEDVHIHIFKATYYFLKLGFLVKVGKFEERLHEIEIGPCIIFDDCLEIFTVVDVAEDCVIKNEIEQPHIVLLLLTALFVSEATLLKAIVPFSLETFSIQKLEFLYASIHREQWRISVGSKFLIYFSNSPLELILIEGGDVKLDEFVEDLADVIELVVVLFAVELKRAINDG